MIVAHADTIAAIATGLGGGVGIVRLSGPKAEQIVGRLVRPWPARPQTHRLYLGFVHDPKSGKRIDEVLACVMRAPRSYTGETVGELHGHGGPLVLRQVLEAAVAEGARPAEPGEFTRRAFESGRIDLTRAEAVAELIAAKSARSLAAAQTLLDGGLEKEIKAVRRELVAALAEVEGGIDFPEERVESEPEGVVARRFAEVARRLSALAALHRPQLCDGLEVVLAGRVNAGKSSLFNALVGHERALVDSEAGTTRDVVEADFPLGGWALRLLDTAGERIDSEAASLERRGIELARRRRRGAQAALLVVDGSVGFLEGERELWRSLEGMARLVVWNKRDLAPEPSGLPDGAKVVETAASTGAGLEELKRSLLEVLGGADEEAGRLTVSGRHEAILRAGAERLAAAAAVLERGEPVELAAVEAREGLNQLGRITGETIETEVLDAIFSRFCIGK